MRDLPSQPTLHDIVKQRILKRDHSVTFLPLLATVVTQHMTGQFIKPCSNGNHRVLSNEESYRLVWESLQRLHYHHHLRYKRRFTNDGVYSTMVFRPSDHLMEYTYSTARQPKIAEQELKSSSFQNMKGMNSSHDEFVRNTALVVLRDLMFMNQYDIEYAIGPTKSAEMTKSNQQQPYCHDSEWNTDGTTNGSITSHQQDQVDALHHSSDCHDTNNVLVSLNNNADISNNDQRIHKEFPVSCNDDDDDSGQIEQKSITWIDHRMFEC